MECLCGFSGTDGERNEGEREEEEKKSHISRDNKPGLNQIVTFTVGTVTDCEMISCSFKSD